LPEWAGNFGHACRTAGWITGKTLLQKLSNGSGHPRDIAIMHATFEVVSQSNV